MLRSKSLVLLRLLLACWLFASMPVLAQEQTIDLPSAYPSTVELELPHQPLDPLEDIKAQLELQTEKLKALQTEITLLQPEKQQEQAKKDYPLGFQGKWDYGLWFESNNKQFKANVGGRVEQDWVWFDTDPNLEAELGRMESGVFFRRARIHGAGRLYDIIDIYAEFEAAPVDNIVFQDMWAQIRDVPLLGNIRAGHIKVPFGLENVTSAKYITFMERAAEQDAFQQEYDPGVMAWYYGKEKNMSWAIAALRFDPEESGRAFGNGRYSGAARMTAVPWSTADDESLLHLGGGFRYNNGGVFDPAAGTDVIRFRARPELRNTNRFVDTGFLSGSGSSFMMFEGAFVNGPFSIQGEYIFTTVYDASRLGGPDLGNANFDGLYVYTSYFLTGERRPYDRTNGSFGRVLPKESVRPNAGRPYWLQGAWELSSRYSYVNLNDPGVDGGVLQTYTAAMTWYLNPNTKVLFNYILAGRNASGSTGDGYANLFGLRFHVAF